MSCSATQISPVDYPRSFSQGTIVGQYNTYVFSPSIVPGFQRSVRDLIISIIKNLKNDSCECSSTHYQSIRHLIRNLIDYILSLSDSFTPVVFDNINSSLIQIQLSFETSVSSESPNFNQILWSLLNLLGSFESEGEDDQETKAMLKTILPILSTETENASITYSDGENAENAENAETSRPSRRTSSRRNHGRRRRGHSCSSEESCKPCENVPESIRTLILEKTTWPSNAINPRDGSLVGSLTPISINDFPIFPPSQPPVVLPSTTTTNNNRFFSIGSSTTTSTNKPQNLFQFLKQGGNNPNNPQTVARDQEILGQLVTNGAIPLTPSALSQQTLDINALGARTAGSGNPGFIPFPNPNNSNALPTPTPSNTAAYSQYLTSVTSAQNRYTADIPIVGQGQALLTYYNSLNTITLLYYVQSAGSLTPEQNRAILSYRESLVSAQTTLTISLAAGVNPTNARSVYNTTVSNAYNNCIAALGGIDNVTNLIKNRPSITTVTSKVYGKIIKVIYSVTLPDTVQSGTFQLDVSQLAVLASRAFRKIIKMSLCSQKEIMSKTRYSNNESTSPGNHQIWNTIISWMINLTSMAAYSYSYNTLGFKFPYPDRPHFFLNYIFDQCYLQKLNTFLSNQTIPTQFTEWASVVIPEEWINILYGYRRNRSCENDVCDPNDGENNEESDTCSNGDRRRGGRGRRSARRNRRRALLENRFSSLNVDVDESSD